jgi:hypothetical protein
MIKGGKNLNCIYRCVLIYADLENNLWIVPTGRSEKMGGAIIGIDIVSGLRSPYSDDELISALKRAMGQCFSMVPDDSLKESAIERYLKVKGYEKAVKNKKLIQFEWNIDDGFYITPTKKEKKGYGFLDDMQIALGNNFKDEELVKGINEALNLCNI